MEKDGIDFVLNDQETSPEISAIRTELDHYNNQFTEEPFVHRPLNILLHDREELIGGLIGGTYWGWLYIDRLWIKAENRKSGLGRRVLEMAEAEAVGRGCRFAHLDTHDFQAVGFYQKNGYEIVSCLENLPPGFNRYLLKKDLV